MNLYQFLLVLQQPKLGGWMEGQSAGDNETSNSRSHSKYLSKVIIRLPGALLEPKLKNKNKLTPKKLPYILGNEIL